MKSLKKVLCAILTTVLLMSAVPVMAYDITMYAPDGRTETVEEGNVQSWSDSGWYTYPVMNVYAPDDRVCVIAKRDLTDWQNSGWYAYPVMNIYSVYNSFPIAKSDWAYWQEQGWYAYPVMNVYAPNGQVCVIAKSDLADWQKMGWYADAGNNEYKNNNQSNQTTNNSSQYQQSMSYNMSPYEKLKSQIMEKGVKTDSGIYGILKYDKDMTVAAIYDPKNSYIGFSIITDISETHLFVYDYKAPEAVHVLYLDDGSEVTFRGVYTSSQITFTYSQYPGLNVDVIKSFNLSYPILDLLMLMNGIDVKISDFGIAY